MARRPKRSNKYQNPREERNQFSYTTHKNQNVIELNFLKKEKKKRIEIIPRSINQENYLDALEDENKHVVFAVGPAGSGKTLIATLFAIRALKNNEIEKIVITRPNVAVDDRDIGFLPGDVFKKLQPWVMPLLDVFAEYYSQKEILYMVEENIIDVVPVAFMRGRTFKNSIIIVDEAQGTTKNSMLSILTRIGENSKMIVTGDLAQSDFVGKNGLSDFLDRFRTSNSIEVIKFNDGDIERHPVIRELLEIYKN
jgi:phosphate starvation-inducible protein PhoH and related proteins